MMRVLLPFLILSTLSLRAEDWTTTDGTAHKNVKVLGHDAGYVTILDDDGGAKIQLSTLPPELQKRFDYDPAKAAACVTATEQQDAKDRQAVAAAQAAQTTANVQHLSDDIKVEKLNATSAQQADAARAQKANLDMELTEDQTKLGDLQDQWNEVKDNHRTSDTDYRADLQAKIKDLKAEIASLQKQDDSLTKTASSIP